MKFYNQHQQANINAYQVIAILIICRFQTFMTSIYCRKIFEVNNSNIFFAMFISLISSLIIFIPAFLLLKQFQFSNIIDISQKIFPKAGKLIPLIFSIYFLLMAIVHVTNTDFFMISYVYIDASPFLVAGIIAVAMYALFLGTKTIFTSGSIILVIFVALNLLMLGLLIPNYNFNNFGPFNLSDQASIIDNISILTFSAELSAMLVLCEYTKSKTILVYSSFQIILFFTEIILMVAVTLSIGHYTNDNMFPVYVMYSTIEASIFERLESVYIVIDTLLSVIKTSIYIFLSAKCLTPIINEKYYKISVSVLAAICLFVTILIIYDIPTLKALLSFINSPLVVSFLIVIIPSILLISAKIKSHKLSNAN